MPNKVRIATVYFAEPDGKYAACVLSDNGPGGPTTQYVVRRTRDQLIDPVGQAVETAKEKAGKGTRVEHKAATLPRDTAVTMFLNHPSSLIDAVYRR